MKYCQGNRFSYNHQKESESDDSRVSLLSYFYKGMQSISEFSPQVYFCILYLKRKVRDCPSNIIMEIIQWTLDSSVISCWLKRGQNTGSWHSAGWQVCICGQKCLRSHSKHWKHLNKQVLDNRLVSLGAIICHLFRHTTILSQTENFLNSSGLEEPIAVALSNLLATYIPRTCLFLMGHHK